VRGAYLRGASCEGRWDAGVDDLTVALPPSRRRPRRRAIVADDDVDATARADGGGGGDEGWLSPLAASLGMPTDPAPAVESSSSKLSATAQVDSMLSPAARKDRPATKKRVTTRLPSTRNKDSKPKDEKEVMNFFDNLLKK
jgi:hypothetical protein